ncbi:hypothetical protein ACFL1A_02965 [Patescibacteria group bacterium]
MLQFRARVRGIGFILWHARHMFYHVLLGLVWAWFLRELWGELNVKWIVLSIFGSILPDLEHLFYFVSYGKADDYGKHVIESLKKRRWRYLVKFIESGHKSNTSLMFHNIYVIIGLLLITSLALFFDQNSWVVIFGAMVIHYIFDIFDDIVCLGYINPNWKRWGREKSKPRSI